jgi:tagaturonate reductase
MSDLPPRILQFGGGNFLRAYFDWMVALLNERTDFHGGVVVVKPTERGDYAELREQQGRFHVRLEGIQHGEVVRDRRLVDVVSDVIHPYRDFAAFLATAGDENIQYIVSNTTEAGIRFVEEPFVEDRCPREFPAKLCRWLYVRWQTTRRECHILPLELIENNGLQLKDCILRAAAHWQLETAFSEWIEEKATFYNTLVDRIVSGYPEDAAIPDDKLLVAGEIYHSLVVDAGETGIPGLPLHEARINVTYTPDLDAHRERKVRLLNGAHTAIVPTGYLAGLDTVGEVMADERMTEYLCTVLFDEIIPGLDQPEDELRAFANDVLDRFRNPSIHHKLLDISLNSTTKFRTRLLPSLLAYHRKFGRLPPGIVRALAALIVFYRGRRAVATLPRRGWGREGAIPLRDVPDRIAFFRQVWKEEQGEGEVVRRVLGRSDWWGRDLNELPDLTQAVSGWVSELS